MGAGRVRLRRRDGADPQHRRQARHAAARGRRSRPCSGLFGKPTIINNVETLANVPAIVAARRRLVQRASAPRRARARRSSPCRARSRAPAWSKWPWARRCARSSSTSAAASPTARSYKAVQIGGPSGGCIPDAAPRHRHRLRVAEDASGAMMGSGGLVVMDEDTCMVDVAKFFMDFIQRESCGKCIPCREGTRRMLEILQRITRGRRNENGHRRPRALPERDAPAAPGRDRSSDTSLCGLGQTAPNPVLSTLRWFRDEYEAHIYERRCPAGACTELVHLHDRRRQVQGLHAVREEVPGRGDRRHAPRARTTSSPTSASAAAVAWTSAASTP